MAPLPSASTHQVLADSFVRTRAQEGALVLGAALCTALFAQVAIPVPGSPVPITGQTLAVVLTAAALGPRRGLAGQVTYLLLGAVGLPFFAKGASGWGQLVGPTGGYLVAFLPTAFLVGSAARLGYDKRPWTAVPLFLVGQFLILAIGVSWLRVKAGLDFSTALQKGFLPFLPGGLLKAVIAGLVMPLAWKFVRPRTP
ncbi:biotin transporter BioY [Corallococcus carmarthensis]|uniref:Biotin transporter n=1 Tax=Corallococcus carmarthensis TaxID=2316728 RepID=A0A3A8JKQ3_9BACT|nr:biotin transporter BioY [Corallococcus carmarthensis]RKG96347.1 biotin transporter BioY [Corallococcus carmarthensis]